MIGKLKGILDSIGEETIIIDVGGVGYEVFCSARTLATLPTIGEPMSMSVETHVRETEIKLFGFSSEMERDWFRLLQSVQGVGAKVALAIQGTLAPADLASAIALQDKAMVARAPGVGPKVAQRIVLELKNKVPAYSADAAMDMGLAHDIGDGVASSAVQDAVSALSNLG
ncbi:MAG: Holliday junction branch migration protein RuvA, partial [Pseudomonadota bacterium]